MGVARLTSDCWEAKIESVVLATAESSLVFIWWYTWQHYDDAPWPYGITAMYTGNYWKPILILYGVKQELTQEYIQCIQHFLYSICSPTKRLKIHLTVFVHCGRTVGKILYQGAAAGWGCVGWWVFMGQSRIQTITPFRLCLSFEDRFVSNHSKSWVYVMETLLTRPEGRIWIKWLFNEQHNILTKCGHQKYFNTSYHP